MNKSSLFTLLLCLLFGLTGIAQQNNGFFQTKEDLLNWKLTHPGSIDKVLYAANSMTEKIVYVVDGKKNKKKPKSIEYWGCVFDGEVFHFHEGKIYNVLAWGPIMMYGRNLILERDEQLRAKALAYFMGKNEVIVERESGFLQATMETVKDMMKEDAELQALLPTDETINERYHNRLLTAVNRYNEKWQEEAAEE
ncbi:MAG: hypothetical protein AAFP19_15525 [Bacteroidota bacterium]